MSTPAGASITPSDPQLEEMARMWGAGWRRYFFPAFWLVYLGQTVNGVATHSHGGSAVTGYVLVVAFAAVYLVALPMGWTGHLRWFWGLYALAMALTVAELRFARADALVFLVYVAVLTVASRVRGSIYIVIAMSVGSYVFQRLVPGFDPSGAWSTALSILLVSLAMFGFFRIVQSNIALTAARAEVARLAAENERSRIARDLHDLLGHSLTTITVKAGLARRLAERGETERAFTEIREVEQLSRRTLGDVRVAVSAHREVTLAGELATAREVLRAAGTISELPASVAEADPALSELFGWVVREGVTNVVRHSRAEHVRITLGRNWVEIVDDGRGGVPRLGNGLCGLRERLEAIGGTLSVSGSLAGFRVRAEVPLDALEALAAPDPLDAGPAGRPAEASAAADRRP
ncbi:MAG: sensor histidine kinase [Jatrophihabitans sp.]|uniref:sensor histidine kinase n=1 Tax=Jatrophihabitans sp. TaxID=1932789 RepID=UPI0039108730